ncbi:hypothetical protein J1605_022564 [Eschrichtius robustus]|uniref:GST N-terminal domain-containing protein n=1 Tax=Eschrichtius robustus TaxID=9764 RepID=A0AB34HBI9_ESCRO|nr:hypothetical protein J1605_022564 [Eschrichtius robustus]
MTLGSWDIRGLVHAARLLPEYTGSNHEEKKYTMGDAPDCDRSQRLREKSKLGLDFPNLPYSIDAAPELTQSNAVLRKHNLRRDRAREDSRGRIGEPGYGCPLGLKKTSAYMKPTHLLPGLLFLKIAMWGNK